jgi:hypothetical protein
VRRASDKDMLCLVWNPNCSSHISPCLVTSVRTFLNNLPTMYNKAC